MTFTVADLIVARLRDAGAVTRFGMPGGGSNLDLSDAANRAGLPFVLTAAETGAAIAAAAAAGLRVADDAGAHMVPATMLWAVAEPTRMLVSNGLSTMGFAVPAAIGAALLNRSTPVVALTGDGGLLMCAGELLTAARERWRVVTVVARPFSGPRTRG